jgi:hypothetical protein
LLQDIFDNTFPELKDTTLARPKDIKGISALRFTLCFVKGDEMEKSVVVIVLAFTLFCVTANAGPTYSFTHIVEPGDGATELADGAIGEAQLFVELTDLGSQVEFTFTNIGPDASSITDVYFDDGTLLGIAEITNTISLVLCKY